MADNFSKWLGGPNFTWARQWGCGKNNSNDSKKKFGDASMRKEKFQNSPRQTIYYRSGLAGLVPNGEG